MNFIHRTKKETNRQVNNIAVAEEDKGKHQMMNTKPQFITVHMKTSS
jgi:hypothetical protein